MISARNANLSTLYDQHERHPFNDHHNKRPLTPKVILFIKGGYVVWGLGKLKLIVFTFTTLTETNGTVLFVLIT